MEYESVIALEIHSELATKTKIFCGCTTEFGGDVNTHCCPICMGMPGTLPVMNKKVVEYAIKAGLAMNCEIREYSKMDRKHYFYPDLPKAYQISQYDLPICENGYLDVEVDGEIRRVRITRIHMEEDSGKSLHNTWGNTTLLDMNRAGVPLIEIVTQPDIRSAKEAKAFLEKVKTILQYIEVSDCKMQEGSLRCDVNVSIMPKGSEVLGTKTEMKNLGSFSAVEKAINSEVARQKSIIESGEKVRQETRRWDEEKGESVFMRSKEYANDYRYFPEPDLLPIVVTKEEIEKIKENIPELPDAKMKRYTSELKLPLYDASLLVASKSLSAFFDATVSLGANPKLVSNWILGDISRILNEQEIDINNLNITAEKLAKLIEKIEDGTISNTAAKTVLDEIISSDKEVENIILEKGLAQVNDELQIQEMIKEIVLNDEKNIAAYKNGKTNVVGYFVGQVMKASKGKANPQIINKLILEELNKI